MKIRYLAIVPLFSLMVACGGSSTPESETPATAASGAESAPPAETAAPSGEAAPAGTEAAPAGGESGGEKPAGEAAPAEGAK